MTHASLLIKNGRAVLPSGISDNTDILVLDGIIAEIGHGLKAEGIKTLDAANGYIFPGFIDVHVHGGGGADFMDGTAEAFETAVKAHFACGTTTLVPTAMTATKNELLSFIAAYHDFKKTSKYASHVAGMHLEGPYFSNADAKSQGAQKGNLIRDVDFEEVEELLSAAKGEIIRWDAAPETPGALSFAEKMDALGIIASVAHSNATGYEAEAGFCHGFSHVTHFYNAVTAYKKRDQIVTAGVVEAAYLDDRVTLELICDGRHIPLHCLKLALKIKGAERVLGITDATRLAATNETSGMLGSLSSGSYVIVDDGVAKLPDLSSYAGSICTMDRALRVLCIDYGIDPVTSAKMLSSSPARHIGLERSHGSIELGKVGDLVITSSSYKILEVVKNGQVHRSNGDHV